ncbi:MAG: carbonic anhydrase [Candidatus Thorarchaeota archaeon]
MEKNIENLLLEGNFKFQSKYSQNQEKYSFYQKIPKYPIIFLTCMDPRIDIHQIFQLNPGDVFILRNAGNIYTLDMMRSILIAIHKYKIKYIIVLGHTDCGMTKINIKELRQNLPNEFLKRLSNNYANLLSKLSDFFKPFDNEIRNVIQQINDLQEIRSIFPDVEIIGMLYNIQNGWIFTQEEFRDLLIKENHSKIYDGLLFEKNQQLSEYLNLNKSVLKKELSESVDEPKIIETNMQEASVVQEIKESNDSFIDNDEFKTPILSENILSQIKMPKIQVPKIYIPKVNFYKPKVKKTV